MNMDPGNSTLLLIGSLTLTVALLYKIQMLLDTSTGHDSEHLERLRSFHRQATQRYLEALKQMDVANEPQLAAEILELENMTSIPAPEYEEMSR